MLLNPLTFHVTLPWLITSKTIMSASIYCIAHMPIIFFHLKEPLQVFFFFQIWKSLIGLKLVYWIVCKIKKKDNRLDLLQWKVSNYISNYIYIVCCKDLLYLMNTLSHVWECAQMYTAGPRKYILSMNPGRRKVVFSSFESCSNDSYFTCEIPRCYAAHNLTHRNWWCQDRPHPQDLYSFQEQPTEMIVQPRQEPWNFPKA